jgi:hypothetical protein
MRKSDHFAEYFFKVDDWPVSRIARLVVRNDGVPQGSEEISEA